MFLGEYIHTFDSKNRISLPAKFRKDLGHVVVITRGLDRCLAIYAKKAWEREAARYASQTSGTTAQRGLARLFLSGSFDTEVDAGGRVLVPENLKAFAGLGKDAVVTGAGDRVEMWKEAAWKKYTADIEKNASEDADTLGGQH